MRLWTIQTLGAWRRLKRVGRLTGDGRRHWHDFRPAYRWMRVQMMRRGCLGPLQHPLWTWHFPRPDLRGGALLSRGIRGVRLELQVPPDRVLLSDFEAWHCVLNRHYLALTEREDDRFEVLCRRRTGKAIPRWSNLPADLRAHVRMSWERIFDLERLASSPVWKPRRGTSDIQGTVAEIRLEEVVRADPFIAR
mgnify:CR=1 FL=1